jgi:cation diffusion facilitator CzcD-associated flavoprotein CzcO
MSEAERVVVVGGGAAGLSTAASLRRLGVDPLVIDRSARIGDSWARRYERLHLHTIRPFSGLAHMGVPRRLPRYLSKDEYAAYLEEYAAKQRLRVALDEGVAALRPGWEVETTRRTVRAEVVVVATGHYAEPLTPNWGGRGQFRGRLLHSADYRTGREFAGLHVLVVGLGNSGAEIAADLVEQGAASVSVAVRTPPPIVTREMFGVVPVQLFGIALMPLGIPRVIDRVAAVLRKRAVGDLRPYGIADAAWGPFTARRPAVIDVGFLDVLRAGRVVVRPAVAALTPTGARYADGSEEGVDVIVAATGFGTGLKGLLREVAGVLDERGQPVDRSGRPTAAPGLFFIGFDETIRGHLFEARRESRRLARLIAASLSPPGTSSA